MIKLDNLEMVRNRGLVVDKAMFGKLLVDGKPVGKYNFYTEMIEYGTYGSVIVFFEKPSYANGVIAKVSYLESDAPVSLYVSNYDLGQAPIPLAPIGMKYREFIITANNFSINASTVWGGDVGYSNLTDEFQRRIYGVSVSLTLF